MKEQVRAETFEDFYDQYVKVRKEDSFLRDELNRMLAVCFEKFPTLKEIQWLGWTPGFNDGDPCTHSQETFLIFEDMIYDYSDFTDGWAPYKSDRTKTFRELNPNVDELETRAFSVDLALVGHLRDEDVNHAERMEKYRQLIDLLDSQELVEMIWETNYQIRVTRESFEHDYYEPGY